MQCQPRMLVNEEWGAERCNSTFGNPRSMIAFKIHSLMDGHRYGSGTQLAKFLHIPEGVIRR